MIYELRELNDRLIAARDAVARRLACVQERNVDFSPDADAVIEQARSDENNAMEAFTAHALTMVDQLSRLLTKEADRRDSEEVVVLRQQIDFIMPDYSAKFGHSPMIEVEDQGQACIFQPDADVGAAITGDNDGCLFVRIQSWDDAKAHPLFTQLMGRRTRLVLEAW